MRARPFLFLTVPLTCLAQGIWENRADYPVLATEVSAAALDGKVYAMCGLTPDGATRRLHIYDPKYDTWTRGADIPIAGGADHCNVAAAAGKVYLLGAIRIGTSLVDGNTYEYDPAVNQWQRIGQMNAPRGSSGVAAVGTKIYVAGGLDPRTSVADFEVFDTVSHQWTRLPGMPTARDHLTAQAIAGKVYAIAGRTTRDLNLNEEYDPAANQWRARAPIPTARGGLGSGAIDGRIQVFGGEGNSGTPAATFQQNEEYDPASDTWRVLAPMPNPRHGLYGATVDGRIFAPSGGPVAGANYAQVHEAFFLPLSLPPRVSPQGVRNAASQQSAIAPGSLISLYGERFSRAEQIAIRYPLRTQMNGTTVKVNGQAAPLLYTSPGQVNVLLPLELTGAPTITVSHAGFDSAPAAIALNDFRSDSAPGIFTLSPEGQGAILIGGTELIARAAEDGTSRPARKGETVEIYCTGLGAVSNPPRPGEAASLTIPALTIGNTIVTIGSARAEVLFSGLAPGLAGVYQVNAIVPAGAPVGPAVAVSINVSEQGLLSNRVTMAIVN